MTQNFSTFLVIDMFSFVIKTPIGKLKIFHSADSLLSIEFVNQSVSCSSPVDPKIKRLIQPLGSYFKNPVSLQDIPYQLHGTDFQRKVWLALTKIPLGKTRTYGELAKELKTSPRAIGMTCRANPLPLIVPCHRIVAHNGIGGFGGKAAGQFIAVKRWLLAHEGVSC